MSRLKTFLKRGLNKLGINLTRNQRYDHLTREIMQQYLRPGSQCIDVGCHTGEMLDWMMQYSPGGNYWAFEPIPALYEALSRKYSGKKVQVYPYALSDEQKSIQFQYVKNAPAYSGIRNRKYNIAHPDIQPIEVQTALLDHLIDATTRVDLIKIDVEGGEYGVIRGAQRLIREQKPLIIFEFGLGAADFYGTSPEMMHQLLSSLGMKVSLLDDFLAKKQALPEEGLAAQFYSGKNYYFIAHP